MTLSDAGFYFKIFCYALGVVMVLWCCAPFIHDLIEEYSQERESKAIDALLERLEREDLRK